MWFESWGREEFLIRDKIATNPHSVGTPLVQPNSLEPAFSKNEGATTVSRSESIPVGVGKGFRDRRGGFRVRNRRENDSGSKGKHFARRVTEKILP